jgi:hypothetical protein
MDLVIGSLIWGALAFLVLRVIARWFDGGAPPRAGGAGGSADGTRKGSPPAPSRPWTAGVLPDGSFREEEAFVDGAVIGYHLAREYHGREVDQLVQELVADARTAPDLDGPGLDATDGFEGDGFEADGFETVEEEADDGASGGWGSDDGFDDGSDEDDDW